MITVAPIAVEGYGVWDGTRSSSLDQNLSRMLIAAALATVPMMATTQELNCRCVASTNRSDGAHGVQGVAGANPAVPSLEVSEN
jgi:hypothetical protein